LLITILMQKLRAVTAQIPLLAQALRLIGRAAPGWTLVWLVLLVIQGLLPVFLVYLTRSVVDGLVMTLNAVGGWNKLPPLLLPLGLMVGVLVLTACIRSLLGIVRSAQSSLVQDHISVLIQEKSVAIDLACYESAEYYDRLFRARNDAAYRPLELVESLGSLLQNSITLVAMGAVLLEFGLWAPAVLIVSTLPVLYIVLDHRLRQYRWRRDNTINERRAWYCDWLLSSRENASEVRLFELGGHFMASFRTIREKLRRDSLRMQRSQAVAELFASFFALLATGLALGWMVWRAAAGSATLGDLALFYQALNQGQQLLRSLLENVGQMYSSSLFLADFFEFLKIRPKINSPGVPLVLPGSLRMGISFDQVSFRYPETERDVLNGFSLDLGAGKITAIVGMNGAGKSTLVKLLCRLYDPDRGRVTLDGIDIRQVAVPDLRRMVTVLFQEPVRYNLTALDNIRVGDLTVSEDDPAIMEAARAAGAEGLIVRLPEGMRTMLGRWFPGSTDLSGGEWQRLALARAFLRGSPVIVLDEPTSAMDSWSELDWLQRFRELARDRTVLIITHRFTTAMQADVIHVMDNGRIVESGTHQGLLALDGRYASSWRKQMRNGA